MWQTVLGGLLTLIETGIAWRSWDGARRVARIPRGNGAKTQAVTVIIPARNEAENITACVQSVLNQTVLNQTVLNQGDLRVIVVDDASIDSTAQRARQAGAEVLRLDTLPAGWAGKNHALARGAERADTPWLVFMDGDVQLSAGALADLLAFAERENLDLLSLGSSQTDHSTAWPLVTPVGFQLILNQAAPDGRGLPKALAVGHFILVRRSTYEQSGGHAAIRASTADDVDLATLLRDAGGRTQFAWGDSLLLSGQLASWPELWRSWRKSFHAGTGGAAPAMLLGGLVFVLWGATPLLLLLSPKARNFALASLLIQAAGRRRIDREMNVPAPYSALGPLARLVLGGILLDAGARAATGQSSRWKGREAPRS